VRRDAACWLGLGAATVALGWLLGRASVPSSYLFAALVLGLVVALRWPDRLAVPDRGFAAAQAITGVVLGAYLQSKSLTAVADSWLAVTLVSAGTLAVCLACGAVLARTTEIDGPTAALGTIAGGASGIVAMARDLGGDDRLVAFMQYARVLVVVLLTPLLAGLLFPGGHAVAGVAGDGPLIGPAKDWAITLACAPLGVLLGRAIRLPAGTLLGPMAIAGALTLTGALGHFVVPPLLREAAFIGIGLQVGLRFTVATVRQVGRLLVPVLLSIAALMVACFGLAVVLHLTAGVSLEDAYLATTPGGLYAVLAVAFGAGANTTFILAVQGLRLLVMILLAPVVVRRMVRPRATIPA
jgi:membrane AbrB-like protein